MTLIRQRRRSALFRSAINTMCRSRRLFSSIWFLLTITSVSVNASAPDRWKAQWEPTRVVNGSPVLFRVNAPPSVKELEGEFLGQELAFRSNAGCRCWYAIAGVGLNTKPGRYELRLNGNREGAQTASFSYTVMVRAAHYPFSKITLPPAFVEPPKEVEPQIAAAEAAKKQAFATTDPNPLWSGPFQRPAEAETSGVFGTARVVNGVQKAQHKGLDFRVTTGTPVHATNAGTVILARPLYFEGNCVMLDHGQGLVTIYMHLSEFKVKEGEKVAAGQLIALSGGTGRSTAPHLHFAVRWRGEYLDPATLLALHPPGK
jgi:murein DD-endopeptidase MepM/ murein hydrolase activator NlpD